MNVSVAKESDIFRTGNGKMYSSEIFDYINLAVLKAYPSSIFQFRVVQKSLNEFEVDIISGSQQTGNAVELFSRLIKQQVGEDVRLVFREVDEIKREPTGKLRYFISELN
jgi:phenylacetate-CoA ligase